MKELGLYKQFVDITIRSYGSYEAHFKAIDNYTKNSGTFTRGWKHFFEYIPYVGKEFKRYRHMPNPNDIPSLNPTSIFPFLQNQWHEYVLRNEVSRRLNKFRKKAVRNN